MKKVYTLALAAIATMGMQAMAASFPVVFNGSETGWSYGDNGKIEDGHLVVEMLENNGKWRQDLSFSSSSAEDDFVVNAAAVSYLAIKFIGERPQGNMTLEIQYRAEDGLKWMNSKWKNHPDGSVLTPSGNNIYYYELTKDDQWTGTLNIDKINFKIADNTAEPHSYTLDWINVYASLDAIEADWKDDGDSDKDEANKVDSPVMIGEKGFANIGDAVNAAVENDVIIVNENQTIGARLNINDRNLTIKGGKDGIEIARNYKGIALLTNNKEGSLTLENLIFTDNRTDAPVFIESSGNSTLTATNVTFKGITSDNGQGIISNKNGGKSILENVTFEDCTVPEGRGEIFVGNKATGTSIKGNNVCTFYIEGQTFITAIELTNTEAIPVYVDADRALENDVTIGEGEEEIVVKQKSAVVLGCSDASLFKMMTEGFELAVDEELGALILAKADTEEPGSAVAEIAADENAPVEFFNLQGLKMNGELTPGIYVRRQGAKTTKVIIK